MTHDEIQKEWDAFIEYPEGSGKLYVTTTSALLFARHIVDMAAARGAYTDQSQSKDFQPANQGEMNETKH